MRPLAALLTYGDPSRPAEFRVSAVPVGTPEGQVKASDVHSLSFQLCGRNSVLCHLVLAAPPTVLWLFTSLLLDPHLPPSPVLQGRDLCSVFQLFFFFFLQLALCGFGHWEAREIEGRRVELVS